MSKPDKAPGADMEEILASIRRIIADGEAGASAGPDFSTRTVQTPELAAAEIHSPTYGMDESADDDANMTRGWETPRSDSDEERILELSDEFVLADGEGAAGLASGAARARRGSGAASQAGQAPGMASALKVEHDSRFEREARVERDVRPDASFRAAAHGSVPEAASPRSGVAASGAAAAAAPALAEPSLAQRTQPRERQPVSFWSRREPYGRQSGAQPAPVQSMAPQAAKETAYGKSHQDAKPHQAAAQGGDRARERWFGGLQAAASESGPTPESARLAREESVPPRDEPKPHRENAPPVSRVEEAVSREFERRPREAAEHRPPPNGNVAQRNGFSHSPAGGQASDIKARPDARPAEPSEQKIAAAFGASFQAEASEGATSVRPAQAGPLEINTVEIPPQATGGALTPAASHAPASVHSASAAQTPAMIGQSEVVAARTSTMVTARQDMATRQEARSYEHNSQMMQAEIMPPNGAGGRTMEDAVKEMLRPMLRQWLNENMPRIVEKVAREEILARAAAANDDKQ
jgi:cell pole-organizing protein PopZ